MFAKKQQTDPKSMAVSRSSPGPTFSVLGADTSIKGDIAASADLHIDGKVEGDISCASLVQGEKSEVFGAIAAETARLAGRVQGSITARELVILKTARIEGDVQYDSLTIEQGAQVDGKLSPRGAQADDPRQASQDVLILASAAQ